jgi:phosphate-selective porin OprO/OprP
MRWTAALARGGRCAAAATLLSIFTTPNASAQDPPPIPGRPVVQDSNVVAAGFPYVPPSVVPSVLPPLTPPGAVSDPVVPNTPVNVPPVPAKPEPVPSAALPSLDPMFTADPASGGAASFPTIDLRAAGRGPRGGDYDSKNISVFLGGRAHLDAVDYALPRTLRGAIPGTNPLNPGVSFRRLRLDASGSIYSHIDYLFQIDFVNGVGFANAPGNPVSTDVAVPTDAWVQFKELPIVGNIKVGNHKPYYSFEHLTSSRCLNFMERSLGFDAFAEGFNNGFEPGISIFDTYMDKRGTWALGVFKNTRNAFAFNVGRNETDVNGRVTFLPIYEEEGKYLLHMGVGASQRDPDNGQVRFRSRFDMRNAPSGLAALIADTGLFNASQQYLLVPELVGVMGPFSFQSEYYGSWLSNASTVASNGTVMPQGSIFLHSWYVEGHLFLTGEHRAYNRNSGVFPWSGRGTASAAGAPGNSRPATAIST